MFRIADANDYVTPKGPIFSVSHFACFNVQAPRKHAVLSFFKDVTGVRCPSSLDSVLLPIHIHRDAVLFLFAYFGVPV